MKKEMNKTLLLVSFMFLILVLNIFVISAARWEIYTGFDYSKIFSNIDSLELDLHISPSSYPYCETKKDCFYLYDRDGEFSIADDYCCRTKYYGETLYGGVCQFSRDSVDQCDSCSVWNPLECRCVYDEALCLPECPDEECNGDETCESCSEDCGECPPIDPCVENPCSDECNPCGEGCDKPEWCEPGFCGDGTCKSVEGEDETNCPEDCRGSICGDGTCDGSESYLDCPEDCTSTNGFCGDGTCDGSESYLDCPEDCGEPVPECQTVDDCGEGCSCVGDPYVDSTCDCPESGVCGDGNIDSGEECDDGNTEDGDGCSLVCTVQAICGQNGCEESLGENYENCPEDCEAPSSICCICINEDESANVVRGQRDETSCTELCGADVKKIESISCDWSLEEHDNLINFEWQRLDKSEFFKDNEFIAGYSDADSISVAPEQRIKLIFNNLPKYIPIGDGQAIKLIPASLTLNAYLVEPDKPDSVIEKIISENSRLECDDGKDNDGDGFKDLEDDFCQDYFWPWEDGYKSDKKSIYPRRVNLIIDAGFSAKNIQGEFESISKKLVIPLKLANPPQAYKIDLGQDMGWDDISDMVIAEALSETDFFVWNPGFRSENWKQSYLYVPRYTDRNRNGILDIFETGETLVGSYCEEGTPTNFYLGYQGLGKIYFRTEDTSSCEFCPQICNNLVELTEISGSSEESFVSIPGDFCLGDDSTKFNLMNQLREVMSERES